MANEKLARAIELLNYEIESGRKSTLENLELAVKRMKDVTGDIEREIAQLRNPEVERDHTKAVIRINHEIQWHVANQESVLSTAMAYAIQTDTAKAKQALLRDVLNIGDVKTNMPAVKINPADLKGSPKAGA